MFTSESLKAIDNQFSCKQFSAYLTNIDRKICVRLWNFDYQTRAWSGSLFDRRNVVEKITSKCRFIPGIVRKFAEWSIIAYNL